MSTFFKQIYRYTRLRAYRHNENLWPFCKIKRSSEGDITQLRYKGQQVPLVPLSTCRNLFSGAAFIVATGPSINKIDFSRLPEMTNVGVNGVYVLKKKIDFHLYVIVDMGFIDRRTEILKEIITDSSLTLFTTLHGIVRIIDYFKLSDIYCQLVPIEDACYRIFKPKIPREKINQRFNQKSYIQFSAVYSDIAFSNNICYGIFDAGTVMFWVFQILLFLGFKYLYIAGLDMANFNQPRFYETEQNKLPSFLEKKFKTLIIPAFTLASDVLQLHGVTVKNLSLNSALSSSIFKKVSLDDAFLD